MDQTPGREPFVAGQAQWWQWLTILSLDAPLVAVAWQFGITRAAGMAWDTAGAFVLGAAVWLAYAADRWVEAQRLEPASVLTQRHWFHRERRVLIAAVWVAVLVAALVVSLRVLDRRELVAGLILLVPVLAYLLSHQWVHRGHPWRAPKEICVALLFVAGVACFPAARQPDLLRQEALPLLVFGVLCFADCALISHWEHAVDRSHGQTSLALQFPTGRVYARVLPWATAAAALALAGFGRAGDRPLFACASLSGGLLGTIDLLEPRLGRQLARALVDLALLTPWLLALAPR